MVQPTRSKGYPHDWKVWLTTPSLGPSDLLPTQQSEAFMITPAQTNAQSHTCRPACPQQVRMPQHIHTSQHVCMPLCAMSHTATQLPLPPSPHVTTYVTMVMCPLSFNMCPTRPPARPQLLRGTPALCHTYELVMVRPLTPHVLPKPHLYPRRLNPFPKPFGSASDPPGSSAYVLFSFTNLRMFLILFLYLILSIPLFTFRSLTLDPDVGYISPVSDSVPD